ncbi:DNA topoisomerase [Sporolactobacillus shoreicorticis]|uniref:DNA topoisomerase n=1 Tax=Sporolactobacillus shoreicorticis TaxID=1923877 RepID=A0ABW5S8C5_9BACL|nr:DNA topoisomerase [Sporolactobacillus shoreicorticis]MCO7126131.1 DNA topoisomerase [Sporolactobacillus shoreicorticis]
MITILAEKPDQARHYAAAFDRASRKDGYFEVIDDLFNEPVFLTYGFGHLVELVEPAVYDPAWEKWSLNTLPMLPSHYRFCVPTDKQKQFAIVKRLLDRSDAIIVATDSDREGENIARSIITQSGNADKPIRRLWINSLETDEIRRGFAELKDGADFVSSYWEAQSRQIADWLVGLNATRLFTLLLRQKGLQGTYSVGRVQTPTLAMIAARQQAIENFKPEKFVEIHGDFQTDNGSYSGKLDQRFPSADEAEALLDQHGLAIGRPSPATVQTVAKKEKREASPRLYSLSDLQARVDKVYHIGPASTLAAVQALYEAKLLSYPRTDCNFITEGEFTYLSANLSSYLLLLGVELHNPEMNAKKRYVDGKKVQEHYAIIPTRNLPSAADLDALPATQRTIYQDVLANTAAMFYPPHVYEETIILTNAGGLIFKTQGKVERDPGWKILFSSEPDKDRPLPQVSEEQGVTTTLAQKEGVTTTLAQKEGVTTPPKPYTEGQLITLMKTAGRTLDAADEAARKTLAETEGLGTEATRSGIIETLKRQNYIVVRKSTVSVTKKGMLLCNVLSGSKLTSPAFTAEWETYLKKIRLHEGTQERFLSGIQRFIVFNGRSPQGPASVHRPAGRSGNSAVDGSLPALRPAGT